MTKTHRGKIGRLPPDLNEHLNRRMAYRDGRPPKP